jgi:hypothetical protein
VLAHQANSATICPGVACMVFPVLFKQPIERWRFGRNAGCLIV